MINPHPAPPPPSLSPYTTSRCVVSTSIASARFASAPCVLYPYIPSTITYLHQPYYLYLFPKYDEAFAYTQAYAMENGISLTKKRTNYREKGGPVRKQDLCYDRGSYQANRVAYQPVKENRKRQRGSQTACEHTVRIQYIAKGVYKGALASLVGAMEVEATHRLVV